MDSSFSSFSSFTFDLLVLLDYSRNNNNKTTRATAKITTALWDGNLHSTDGVVRLHCLLLQQCFIQSPFSTAASHENLGTPNNSVRERGVHPSLFPLWSIAGGWNLVPRFCLPSVSISAVRGRVLLLLLLVAEKRRRRGWNRKMVLVVANARFTWFLSSFSVPLYSLLILFIARCWLPLFESISLAGEPECKSTFALATALQLSFCLAIPLTHLSTA